MEAGWPSAGLQYCQAWRRLGHLRDGGSEEEARPVKKVVRGCCREGRNEEQYEMEDSWLRTTGSAWGIRQC
jgi:hypothetical protein